MHNLIQSTNSPLFEGQEGSGWTWESNIAFGAALGISARSGLLQVDPELELGDDGLWRLSANSFAIDNGTAISSITTDMDGQARIGLIDIGADEFSTAAIVRKPLTTDDVGPNWGEQPAAGDFVALQAEGFTRITDPNGDGNTWRVVADEAAHGELAIEASAGSRTNSSDHDSLALYDLVFGEAGECTAYYRAYGVSGATTRFTLRPILVSTRQSTRLLQQTEFTVGSLAKLSRSLIPT